jgi:hypothetical protein
MKYLLFLIPLLVLSCHPQICRDKNVYANEITFITQVNQQSGDKLETLIKTSCKCKDNKFVDKNCEDAAQLVALLKSRLSWHASMMLYNAKITTVRPSDTPPVIPPPETYCPKEEIIPNGH